MEPIAVHDVRVVIFYGHFVIRDQWCDAGDDGASLAASRDCVVAASTYELTVQALSQVAGLTIRLWENEPPSDTAGWDGGRGVIVHFPTGELIVDQITSGSAASITLPAGEGIYGMRVYWVGSEVAQAAVSKADERHQDDALEQLSVALKEPDGTERYLLDAWRQGPLPPDEDDDDFNDERGQ